MGMLTPNDTTPYLTGLVNLERTGPILRSKLEIAGSRSRQVGMTKARTPRIVLGVPQTRPITLLGD